MIAKLDNSKTRINLTFQTRLESDQAYMFFTRKKKNSFFKKKKNRFFKEETRFIKNDTIPIGLWNELRTMSSKFRLPLKFDDFNNFLDNSINYEYVDLFVEKLLEGTEFKKDEDQLKAVLKAIKYKRCIIDGCTSFGKTIVMYMISMLLLHRKLTNKILIITLDPGLVIQCRDDFITYCSGKYDLKMGVVYGGNFPLDIDKKKIVICNFQAGVNLSEGFLKTFDTVLIDEVHRSNTEYHNTIFRKIGNERIVRKIGFTGSIRDDKTAEFYELLSLYGPIVHKISKRYWIDKGMAADLEIICTVLNYADVDTRRRLAEIRSKATDYTKVVDMEMQAIRNSQIRLDFLAGHILKQNGNSICFFIDKKNGYGKKIAEALRLIGGKDIYYIDGDTPQKTRELYKKRISESNNAVLVASFPTYSTGQSIKSIENIYLAESRKAFELLSQTLGRGMRLDKERGKLKCKIWDIADDFSIDEQFSEYKGYSLQHLQERIAIYKEEQLKYTIKKINLTNERLNW